MQRLKKPFQPILIILFMANLASCGTNPFAAHTPDTATANAKGVTTASVSDTGTTPVKETQETVPHDAYIIQPGDELSISVWKEKDLDGTVVVRPDGGLNFPLVGYITAAGKTVEHLKKDITANLSKYVPDPVVTVAVRQSLGNRIYVIGEVNKPGDYAANRTIDVMQALSMAGGLNPYAAVNKIKILRRVNDEQKTFLFKYSQVEKGENLEQNIILQGGDIVIVP